MIAILLLGFMSTACFGNLLSYRDESDSPQTPISDLEFGDMRLTDKQLDRINKGLDVSPDDTSFSATNNPYHRWPNAVIPYEFDCSLEFMPSAHEAVKKAMAEWESKTCLRFVKRTTEKDYLRFFRNTHCWGNVGRIGGASRISIGHGCDYQHVMAHEIGHVVGFFHEQNRNDRDDWVKVHWENINEWVKSAFRKVKDSDTHGTQYDYASIMHYPWHAFSKNGKNTMEPLKPVKILPYEHVSELDAVQTARMYKCKEVMRKREVAASLNILGQSNDNADDCEDQNVHCKSWARAGYCSNNHVVFEKCKKSCKVPSCDKNVVCQDQYASCPAWAKAGHCRLNPTVAKVCKLSCLPVCKNKPTQPPATEAPQSTGAPVTDAPVTEAPVTDAPATEAPQSTDAPVTDAPVTEAPVTDAPVTDAPVTDAPVTDAPVTDAPVTDAPVTDAPETDAPVTDAPVTDAPVTDAPVTDAPEVTEPPPTDAPATEPGTIPNTDLMLMKRAADNACKDEYPSCPDWAKMGHCKLNPRVAQVCTLSCSPSCKGKPQGTSTPVTQPRPVTDSNVVGPLPTTSIKTVRLGHGRLCFDKEPKNCQYWASIGECESNPGWMLRNCLISCKVKTCDMTRPKPPGKCADPLGLSYDGKSWKIPDSAFSASSFLRPGGGWEASPQNARLYMEDDYKNFRIGSWCLKSWEDLPNAYVQVDLQQQKTITYIATQGRDKYYERVRTFKIGYSNDGKNFQDYEEDGKAKIFDGNCDHFTPILNKFKNPIRAQYVRFYPIKSNYPCVRMEFYGC